MRFSLLQSATNAYVQYYSNLTSLSLYTLTFGPLLIDRFWSAHRPRLRSIWRAGGQLQGLALAYIDYGSSTVFEFASVV